MMAINPAPAEAHIGPATPIRWTRTMDMKTFAHNSNTLSRRDLRNPRGPIKASDRGAMTKLTNTKAPPAT
jgi:hypothetical protein